MDHTNQQRKVLTNVERSLDLNSTSHNEIITCLPNIETSHSPMCTTRTNQKPRSCIQMGASMVTTASV